MSLLEVVDSSVSFLSPPQLHITSGRPLVSLSKQPTVYNKGLVNQRQLKLLGFREGQHQKLKFSICGKCLRWLIFYQKLIAAFLRESN